MVRFQMLLNDLQIGVLPITWPGIRFPRKQVCKQLVFNRELYHIIFHLNFGMDFRPKMSGSNKSKKRENILGSFAAKGVSQHF
jgi:hypothetical protein